MVARAYVDATLPDGTFVLAAAGINPRAPDVRDAYLGLIEAHTRALGRPPDGIVISHEGGTLRMETITGAPEGHVVLGPEPGAGAIAEHEDQYKTLVEYARAEKEAEFRDLARMLGVPGERLAEFWTETRRRVK